MQAHSAASRVMSATAARVASEEEAKEVEDNKRKKKKRRKSGTVLLGTLTWQVGESIIASS